MLNKKELINQLIELFNNYDTMDSFEIINTLQESKEFVCILEDVKSILSKTNDCCPYCGCTSYNTVKNSNGVSGYYYHEWVEGVCTNCKENF